MNYLSYIFISRNQSLVICTSWAVYSGVESNGIWANGATLILMEGCYQQFLNLNEGRDIMGPSKVYSPMHPHWLCWSRTGPVAICSFLEELVFFSFSLLFFEKKCCLINPDTLTFVWINIHRIALQKLQQQWQRQQCDASWALAEIYNSIPTWK